MRAVFGLREVGVLGLEREGMVDAAVSEGGGCVLASRCECYNTRGPNSLAIEGRIRFNYLMKRS